MLRYIGLHTIANSGVAEVPTLRLSRRERDVVTGLIRGYSNQEIAVHLSITLATVKLHVRSVCQKLNAENRTQAPLIAYAAMHGMVWHEQKTRLVL